MLLKSSSWKRKCLLHSTLFLSPKLCKEIECVQCGVWNIVQFILMSHLVLSGLHLGCCKNMKTAWNKESVVETVNTTSKWRRLPLSLKCSNSELINTCTFFFLFFFYFLCFIYYCYQFFGVCDINNNILCFDIPIAYSLCFFYVRVFFTFN